MRVLKLANNDCCHHDGVRDFCKEMTLCMTLEEINKQMNKVDGPNGFISCGGRYFVQNDDSKV